MIAPEKSGAKGIYFTNCILNGGGYTIYTLVKEQFSEEGLATIQLKFQGKNIEIRYVNADGLDYGEYHVQSVQTEEGIETIREGDTLRIPAEQIAKMSEYGVHRIVITLGK